MKLRNKGPGVKPGEEGAGFFSVLSVG